MLSQFLLASLLLSCSLALINGSVVQLKTKSHVPNSLHGSRLFPHLKNHPLKGLLAHLDTLKLSSGANPLVDYYGMLLIDQLTIGTPPQPFSVLVDTLTAELWVVDSQSNVSSNSNIPQHQYNMTASSTAKANGRTFAISNTTSWGNVRGPLVNDTVALGDLQVTSEVGRAIDYDMLFAYMPVDGVLGLAWPARSTSNVKNPVFQIFNGPSPQGSRIFSIYLDPSGSLTSNSTGQLTIGGVDTTNCNDDFTYIPLTSKSFWQFQVKNVMAVGKKETGIITNSRQAVLGSISAFALGPTDDVKAIAKVIGAKITSNDKFYYVSCNATNLPDVVFDLGTVRVIIPPSRYVTPFTRDDTDCYIAFGDIGMIEQSGTFLPDWYIGTGLIPNYCTAYDVDNAKVGFGTSISGTAQ